MTTGIEMIAQERERQITDEGWTADHDDRYTSDQLIRAALCYAHPPALRDESPVKEGIDGWETCSTREAQYYIPELWPFSPEDWKPAHRLKELARAGALIAAEIDRRMRKQYS